jgi:hypothetical protein
MMRPTSTLLLCATAGAVLLACAVDAPPGERVAVPVDTLGLDVRSALPRLPSVGPVEIDSGPAVRVEARANAVRLVMVPNPGDQINALQPPALHMTTGRRILFGASAVTGDSAYFVGDVTATLPDSARPVEGTLTTSYCRAGEKLCRIAKRTVRVP